MVEKILWKERKCFKSFLPIVFIGILTLWIYGIGIIFIAYAISKWFRITYTITEDFANHRALCFSQKGEKRNKL